MKPGPISPVPQRPFDDATTSGHAALAIREDTHNSYQAYYGLASWIKSSRVLDHYSSGERSSAELTRGLKLIDDELAHAQHLLVRTGALK